jgi:hypothetical protein
VPDDEHITAHKSSSSHRSQLEASLSCGCFHCLAIFSPRAIEEWVDDETTAMRPKCGIDSVIGDASGYPVTEPFLKRMQRHWF